MSVNRSLQYNFQSLHNNLFSRYAIIYFIDPLTAKHLECAQIFTIINSAVINNLEHEYFL